jgi:FkbM family methyltransferase
MNEYKFNSYGVDYEFLGSENTSIPCFGWYMNVFSSENWERETFDIFNKVKDKNKIAVDIGGWMGSTCIWLSKNFESVIVVESDKNALIAMENNLKRNSCENVTIIDRAIYNEDDVEVYFGINEITGTGLGDSMSQIKNFSGNSNDYRTKTITLKNIVENYGKEKISFLKIDIEGGEEMILHDIFEIGEKYNLKFWVSFHYPWWKDKNIERFSYLLDHSVKIYFNDSLMDKQNFFNALLNHQFGSFYFDFS